MTDADVDEGWKKLYETDGIVHKRGPPSEKDDDIDNVCHSAAIWQRKKKTFENKEEIPKKERSRSINFPRISDNAVMKALQVAKGKGYHEADRITFESKTYILEED